MTYDMHSCKNYREYIKYILKELPNLPYILYLIFYISKYHICPLVSFEFRQIYCIHLLLFVILANIFVLEYM